MTCTNVHCTKTSTFSYSVKPYYAWGGCGGHFSKWPLSQKIRGTEPSMSTLVYGFVGRRFQKKYCRIHHHIVSVTLEAILKNGGHFQSITSISETKRSRAFNTTGTGHVKTIIIIYHTVVRQTAKIDD